MVPEFQAAKPGMANPCASISLTGGLALALLVSTLQATQERAMAASGGARRPSDDYVPVRTVVYRASALPELPHEPFQVCSGCRCCSPSDSSNCVDTRCCFRINCNIPGKPFGTCAFTPFTCGCGANNCSSSPLLI